MHTTHRHGLSRGNAIFETRRSRKAIIPKAVLIKAQPRYIVAMPHTPYLSDPDCTLPSSYRPFFHPPVPSSRTLFHGKRHGTSAQPPYLFVDGRIFFFFSFILSLYFFFLLFLRDSSLRAPGVQIARRPTIFYPPRFIIFNDGHFIT